MSEANHVVLACSGLGRSFAQGREALTVLRDISLTVQRGERVAIVGVSGSGKSTLLHLLGGLDLSVVSYAIARLGLCTSFIICCRSSAHSIMSPCPC